MRFVFATILVHLAAFAPSPADACSPDICIRPAFAPNNGGVLPANGTIAFRASGNDQDGNPPDGLVIVRVEDGSPVSFEVERDQRVSDTYLIHFVGEPSPGVYRATFPDRGCYGDGPLPDRVVTFTVIEPAPLPGWAGQPRAGGSSREDISVWTSSGSCFAEIDATVRTVGVVPGCDAWPWRDVARYSLGIDRYWEGDLLFYGEVPSWRLHAACGATEQGADRGLGEGTHTGSVSLFLPGERAPIDSSQVSVTLDCDAPGGNQPSDAPICATEPDDPTDPDDPEEPTPPRSGADSGGCATGGGTPSGSDLLLVLFALVSRSRGRIGSEGRRTPVVSALFAFVLLVAADVALACEPDPCIRARFAPKDGGSVPANGALAFRPSGDSWEGTNVPDGLSIERADSGAPAAIEVTPDPRMYGTFTVRFLGGPEPGEYRATFPNRACGDDGPLPDHVVTFTVAPASPLPDSPGQAFADASERTSVRVRDSDWDCLTQEIEAELLEVGFVPSCSAWPWRDVGLFLSSLGSSTAADFFGDRFYGDTPGWQLHTTCTPTPDNLEQGLEEGEHSGTLILRLPGESRDVESPFTVTLACGGTEGNWPAPLPTCLDTSGPSDPGGPDSPDVSAGAGADTTGCACSTPGSSAPGFGFLALVLLARRRR